MRTHSEPVRVEFVDTDAGGRIHHTAALRWAERAEHQLLRAAGAVDLTSYPRRHVVVDFLAPLRFGDEVQVEVRATNLGRTSITYGWRVVRDGAVCVQGSTTCVHVDAHDQPAELPPALRAGLGAVVSEPTPPG
ncbi:acyl-CoA thioesterase [Actinotalea subterranea]|uniref:acyl-CoA thioesterase n=1 Tax=Actinotalea subterranea TaxID=2607497 RepID=UPI0011ED8DB9|nr:thioesterase family protein [Actinotalea subterranea]